VEPAAARSDSPAPRLALHSPYNTSGITMITNSPAALADHAELNGIGAVLARSSVACRYWEKIGGYRGQHQALQGRRAARAAVCVVRLPLQLLPVLLGERQRS
jgi:hypothetical protein